MFSPVLKVKEWDWDVLNDMRKMGRFGTFFQWEMKNDGGTWEVCFMTQWKKWNVLNFSNSIRCAYMNDLLLNA